jgi:nucleotide-binding universal stress UspA family protein
VEGATREVLSEHARYVDLVVLGQEEHGRGTGLVEAAIFGAGRPVLVVPFAGRFDTIGERVLVCWNGSREASRAVHDGMALLTAAQSVRVMAVNQAGGVGAEQDVPAADLAAHLARHGVRASAEHTVAPGIEPAEAILNEVAEGGIDLLVMGAYGHSRIRELVMGGVTRTLLRSMTVPVLMAH